MSQLNLGRTRTYKASVALTAKQFYIVALDTANQNQIVLANAQTLPTIGIVANAPAANDIAEVHGMNGQGTMKVALGGTVAIGDKITANASGLGITTTTAGDIVVGIALKAGISGNIIEIQLDGGRY